jgi:hypothetical protein
MVADGAEQDFIQCLGLLLALEHGQRRVTLLGERPSINGRVGLQSARWPPSASAWA